jgi:hypothetical protein
VDDAVAGDEDVAIAMVERRMDRFIVSGLIS